MRRRYAILGLLVLGSLLLFSAWSGQAQSDLVGQCPALVERAMAEADLNCSELDRNHACYGFNRVNSTFVRAMDEGVFDQPADRVEVADLQSIQTVPLSSEDGYWGVALMRLQANIPNTLPGQAVVFVLVGEVQMDNAVPAEQVAPAVEPIPLEVVPASGANVRSGPGTNTNVVGSVLAGTELATDGRSEDGTWLRVAYQDAPAWISREVVEAPGRDLDSLPVINEELLTPMQAFTFQTGVGEPECSEAPPSVIVVQGPQDMTIDISANGANIRLGSTVLLRTLGAQPEGVNPPDDGTPPLMEIIVLDGHAEIEDGPTIEEGYSAHVGLNEEGIIDDGDSWSEPELMEEEGLRLWEGLTNFGPNLRIYPIQLPDLSGITNATLPLSLPPTCNNLQIISPEGLLNGENTVYWTMDGAPPSQGNAVLNVTNEAGALVGSFQTPASNMNLTADFSEANIGSGYVFYLQVQVGGCTSPVKMLLREAAPAPGLCGNNICDSSEIRVGRRGSCTTCPADCGVSRMVPACP